MENNIKNIINSFFKNNLIPLFIDNIFLYNNIYYLSIGYNKIITIDKNLLCNILKIELINKLNIKNIELKILYTILCNNESENIINTLNNIHKDIKDNTTQSIINNNNYIENHNNYTLNNIILDKNNFKRIQNLKLIKNNDNIKILTYKDLDYIKQFEYIDNYIKLYNKIPSEKIVYYIDENNIYQIGYAIKIFKSNKYFNQNILNEFNNKYKNYL